MILNLLYLVFLTTFASGSPQNLRYSKNIAPAQVNHLEGPPVLSSNNLEDTIKEVEEMIRSNPKLPRLTRGEIIDLLENITKTDNSLALQQQALQGHSYLKERKPKAVMKVLPFTPDENGNNVEDLYTKPPVTQIVGSQQLKLKPEVGNNLMVQDDIPLAPQNKVNVLYKPAEDKMKKYRGSQRFKPNLSTSSEILPDSQSSSSERPIPPPGSFIERKPQKFRRKQPQTSTTTTAPPSITTYNSKGRKPTRRRKITTSTTTRYSNHKYEDELSAESSETSSSTLFPSNGIKIIAPPSLPPKVINDDLLFPLEDKKKEVWVNKENPVSYVPVKDIDLSVGDDDGNEENDGLPFSVEIPDHLKGVVADLNLETALKNLPQKQKPNSKKPTKTSSKNVPEKSDDIQNLLAALAMLENQTTTTSTTTTTPLPDINNVVDTLTPEMKDLLMNFGLIPNTNPKSVQQQNLVSESYNPEKAEVRPDSYIGFKPLPNDDNSRDEMQELLARFGLGRSVRNQKSLDHKPKNGGNEMGVPDEYKTILEDIGFSKQEDDNKSETDSSTSIKHVFNPSENIYVNKDEIEKLNKLSNVIKHLESLNRPLTSEDLKQIDVDTLKILVESLNNSVVPLDEQDAPDPLKYDYDIIKNEVKRQENSTENPQSTQDTISTEASNGSTESSTAESSTEIAATPNIKDLEDSFGGKSESTSQTAAPETTPAPKRTGFYYLLDWNSFFDLDDQKGRRVNLRLQPKAGDPKRFYSVTVP